MPEAVTAYWNFHYGVVLEMYLGDGVRVFVRK
jgi:hypothetical protein